MPELRVCALYPDLMNIYADRGNLLVLERRCRWRGIGFELKSSSLGDSLDPDGADLYYMGAGRTATSNCARSTWPRSSGTRCTRRRLGAP